MQKRATRRLLMMTISAASSSAIPGQTGPNPEGDAAETFLIETVLGGGALARGSAPGGGHSPPLAHRAIPPAPTDWSVQVSHFRFPLRQPVQRSRQELVSMDNRSPSPLDGILTTH